MLKRIIIGIILVLLGATLVGGLSGCAKKKTEELPPVPITKKGPETVVPKDLSLEAYVEHYYKAYQEKRWEDAYKLLPAAAKAKEDLQAFIKMRSELPLEGYTIKPAAVQGSQATVTVELSLTGTPQSEGWSTIWAFSKKSGKWIAESTKSVIK